MLKISTFITAAAILILIGCRRPEEKRVEMEVIEVDNCQYIVWFGIYHDAIIHKADCHNPVHSHNWFQTLVDSAKIKHD